MENKYIYKRVLLICFIFLAKNPSFLVAQNIVNYTFAAASGTFSALTGATSPALSSGNADDGYFNAIPIGFDFWYMGIHYSTVSASTNGWLTLGANIFNSGSSNSIATGGTPRPVIAPLWDDLNLQAASNFSYKTTGSSGSQIFTIEYLNLKWNYAAAGNTISMQVKFYEGTGKIEFIYRQETGSVNSATASIGITSTSTGSGNYLSLNGTGASPTASSTTATNNLNTKPANGQTYSFTPSVPTAPSNLTFTTIDGAYMTVNWTDNSSDENGFAIYRSTDGSTYSYINQVPANTTSSLQSNLLSSTIYYYKVYAVSEGGRSAALSGSQVTLCAGPTISQVPVTNLIANYKLEGDANDATNNNHGAFQNGDPTQYSDRFGIANKAYAFNGSSQYVSTTNAYLNPGEFSINAWFKTNTITGGVLIGFSSKQTGTGGNRDRLIYMANDGTLYLGVAPGAVKTVINSTSSYNDNNWHMVTGTLSSTEGLKLYIDGSLIASDASITSAENYTGYWRMGHNDAAGWAFQPTSFYFNGTLDDILVYHQALSQSEISTIYTSPDGASSDGPVCAGSTLNFTGPTVNTATYAWTGPNGFSSASQNPSLTYAAAYAGTYTVEVTLSGCSSKAFVSVTLNTTLAGQWTGSTSTDWSNTGNWCNAALPTSTTDVIIPGTAPLMPSISSSVTCDTLTIDVSGTLTIASGGTLSIYGNLTNNGTYTDNGTTVFTGSAAQDVTGSTTFNHLTINNSNGVTLNNASTVSGILTLTSGTLASGGNLTVNLNTGAIAGTGTGAITGNVTLYKTVNSAKYHYITSPLSGLTVSDWNDDVPISTGTQYHNLYKYNETYTDTTKTVGWEAITSLSASLEDMKGYALYYSGAATMDVTGVYSHSASYTSPVLTNTISSTDGVGNAGSDGWNLMGNPYASAIDWDAATGWTKTSLNDAIYFWDPVNNRYASYVAGSGTNGGTRYIPSMQGFWIKVSTAGGTGSLSMNNNVRVTSTNPAVWRTSFTSNILKLTASSSNYSDETVIRFREDAEESFDSHADAYKKMNTESSPSLYTFLGKDKYSINSLPYDFIEKSIPVKLNAGFTGIYTFTADQISSFESGYSILFEDRVLGKIQDLRTTNSYTCEVQQGDTTERFYIHFRKAVESSAITSNDSRQILITGSGNSIHIRFNGLETNQATIMISNILGRELFLIENATIANGEYSILLPAEQAGIYIVKVLTPDLLKTEKIYRNQF